MVYHLRKGRRSILWVGRLGNGYFRRLKGMMIPDAIVDRLKALPIEEVAERLGMTIERHAALCFMHNDHVPSLKFNVSRNIYRCFVCDKGGGPIRLVQDYKAWPFQESCAWLANQFNIRYSGDEINQKSVSRAIRKRRLHTSNEVVVEFDAEVLTWLINTARLSPSACKFLFEERHFKREVVERLHIISISDSKHLVGTLVRRYGESRCLKSRIVRQGKYGLCCSFFTPCLLFPYYEQDGRLAGIQSRYLGEKKNVPRFQFLSSQKTRLFNLPALNTLKQGDKLYISEGITDCLAMLSAGMNAVAIPSATILPLEDLVTLKKYDLHMYPDQDEAGFRAFTQLRRFFVNQYSTLRAERLPEGIKDYCDYYVKSQGANGEDEIHL